MGKLHEYAFDCKLQCALRVNAASYEDAVQRLRTTLDASTAHLGEWPDGAPIQAEVSLAEDPDLHLYELDGEEVDGEDDICIACGGPDNDGEGYAGLCSHCADVSDNDQQVLAWARRECPGLTRSELNEDLRVDYARARAEHDAARED
jgi:hypothetical protein